MIQVPFVDLKVQHRAIQPELDEAIRHVMERADFALGQDVAAFEEEFAAYCGAGYAVGVDSGLSALELSLRAFGIGCGDEVIVPANTFIATAAAVTFAGARPVLVDVDPTTHNLDVVKMEAAMTARTRAVIPVHLYGLPADMDAILQVARRRGLIVIEDACQAHGAKYRGRRAGTLGHAAAFSFYPTKNLGACGDAGMVLTGDAAIAERVRTMRNCGQRQKYVHEYPSFNHRLDSIQAAILRVKLRYLDGWLEARRRNAALYSRLLERDSVITPVEPAGCEHVYHIYAIRSTRRDALRAYLEQNGVATAIHYPIPIHLQPAYSLNGYWRGQFPVSELLAGQILSLPMFPELTAEQVQYVTQHIRTFGSVSEQPMTSLEQARGACRVPGLESCRAAKRDKAHP